MIEGKHITLKNCNNTLLGGEIGICNKMITQNSTHRKFFCDNDDMVNYCVHCIQHWKPTILQCYLSHNAKILNTYCVPNVCNRTYGQTMYIFIECSPVINFGTPYCFFVLLLGLTIWVPVCGKLFCKIVLNFLLVCCLSSLIR